MEQDDTMVQSMSSSRSGAMVIVCAPSGAGKSTLINRLRQEFPRIAFSISCTTRAPRDGEKDGVDYYFWDKETFLIRKKMGYFAESANVHGNWYGTPLGALKDMLKAGRDVVFDIDVQGAAQLRESVPGGRYVFILPPSMAELERRLRARGADSEEAIFRRLSGAASEIREAEWFDAWIINESLETAYDELRAFYLAATLAPALRPEFTRNLLLEAE